MILGFLEDLPHLFVHVVESTRLWCVHSNRFLLIRRDQKCGCLLDSFTQAKETNRKQSSTSIQHCRSVEERTKERKKKKRGELVLNCFLD